MGKNSPAAASGVDRTPSKDKAISRHSSREQGQVRSLQLEVFRRLRDAVEVAAADYVNSSIVVETGENNKRVGLDIKDVLLLGAITASDCLLTGHTGTGKTHLAKMVMTALFGDKGYFNKTITPGMSASDFLDIDFPAIQRGERTLREAMQGLPLTRLPGIILNEPNRAPELVQAVLIPFFDQEFEIEGVPIPLGVACENGRRYQFRVLTINEGPQYSGVVSLDRAVRDRAVIEVPLDLLPMSNADVRNMFEVRTTAKLAVPESGDLLPDVLSMHAFTETLPLHPMARELLVYFNGLGNCVRSRTGTKHGIAFTPSLCEGCHHAAALNGICGAVFKPSPRALINLQAVARGVAAIRMCKGDPGEDQQVTVEDVVAAAPLVLYSKLEIDAAWIAKTFQGNKWAAVREVVNQAKLRLETFLRTNLDIVKAMGEGVELTPAQVRKYQGYIQEKDAWLATWQEVGLPFQ